MTSLQDLDMGFKNWLRLSWHKALLLTLLTSGFAVNGIAWMQAYSMTHYVAGGERTTRPEKLSLAEKVGVVLTGVRLPRPANHQTPEQIGLGYETIQIEISNEEKLEAWFVPVASTRGIVLLFPPYGGSKQTLLAPGKILHDLGYELLLVDFRGVGGSSGSDTTLGVREAKDVARAVAYTQQRWSGRPIVLYGASMGAAAVMRAIADEGVSPTAIILESPFDRLLNTVRHRFDAMRLPSFPAAELIVWWGGWQQGINGFAHNPVESAKEIECPTLLIYGEDDKRVTLQEVKSIFDHLPGQKQFAVFSGIGHGSLAIDNPVKWKQQVQNFLQIKEL
ncbi:alpha/beta hydrolase [Kovacikia minuta CCNUW1]|uniref:alpha/beta hydrolase n=1 Tax=Kovacikia minuta TaxID=2931930 RepID=UPI001CC90EF1|nr:alpha/beta hydrolase [Kovacikia minuta]UBF27196.1 alpha/beta hydrolase [Kovacikia minuta CCNUW1]